MQEKLIVNAVINPLTALFGVKNHAIITNKYIHNLAHKLCEEAALTLGLNVDKSWELVLTVADKTGENTSSMWADIKQKRKTEIEAISGYLLKQGKQDMPYTKFIYQAILGMEQEAMI